MSFEAMTWALKQKKIGSTSKLVLLLLANHSNGHTGQCNPRIKFIADECDLSEKTVRSAIKHLVEINVIKVENRFSENGQSSNQYWLNMARGVENYGGGGVNFTGGGYPNLPTYITSNINQDYIASSDNVSTGVGGGDKNTSVVCGEGEPSGKVNDESLVEFRVAKKLDDYIAANPNGFSRRSNGELKKWASQIKWVMKNKEDVSDPIMILAYLVCFADDEISRKYLPCKDNIKNQFKNAHYLKFAEEANIRYTSFSEKVKCYVMESNTTSQSSLTKTSLENNSSQQTTLGV